jgi:hypothetical protein
MKKTFSRLNKNQLFRFFESDYNPSIYNGIVSNCYTYYDEDGDLMYSKIDKTVIAY